jgi:hypothetical protein
MYVFIYLRMYVCMQCMYVLIYVCIYAMYKYVRMHVYIIVLPSTIQYV